MSISEQSQVTVVIDRSTPMTETISRSAERWHQSRLRRQGFTIVELLVTIGLIGLLTSLITPAVMKSHETARKLKCANNLRQFGVGMHTIEGQFNVFPPIRKPWPFRDPISNNPVGSGFRLQTSPHVSLLSALGLNSLAEQLQIENDNFHYGDPVLSELNSNLLTITIPVFLCPSGDSLPGSTTYMMSNGTCPSNGVVHTGDPRTSALPGAFTPGNGRAASDVVDGLSNTVAFSERLTGDRDLAQYTPWRDIAAAEGNTYPRPDLMRARCEALQLPINRHLSFGGANWLVGEFGITRYNHILPPNSPIPDCGGSGSSFGGLAVVSARSLHSGGVYCLFLDGSVSFVSETIDADVWGAIGTISGAETNVDF